ncbi:MAG: N-acetylmuramoyl-L-alanine amidase [Candidatus Omnitrophica bacterium]|nr:N-acetylmuramoyl-L-alanine amidase [Candidatus Omnitrophota bacterium]MBU1933435.1 N-acetylmuramoyl-L-alanine amidase [Candidatus Omnitrophota bacterium]
MRKSGFLLCIVLVFTLTSCARAPVRTQSPHTLGPYSTVPEGVMTVPEIFRSDVMHEVGPGETVWRLSRMYDVGVQDIVNTNSLADSSKLEKGQKLLIPNAAPLRSVIPIWPSNKWKYIIIHHSATDVGKALSFDYVHSHKRHWKGLGYHFVIDNGTSGKKDGQIEVSPRWVHQEDGAHCKAGGMNYKGIGICLVGNFNSGTVSPQQMEALVSLVKELKKHYRIPDSRIMGHGQVPGANTDCPGKRFPWNDFWRRLKS